MNSNLVKEQIQEVYFGQPWYGSSVVETLKFIPFEIVNKKISEDGHSIAELVLHMMSWRTFVIEKINENKEFDIEINSSQDWEKGVYIESEEDWKSLVNNTVESIEKIVQALSHKSDEWFQQKTKGKDYRNEHMIRGIIYHDVYHLGQIRMLYKLVDNK